MNDLKDKARKLCLAFADLTRRTYFYGPYDIPGIRADDFGPIHALVRYSEGQAACRKAKNAALCFFDDDILFDGKDGLFAALRVNDEALLAKYRKRFAGVRCVIAPDYSLLGDAPFVENVYRIYKQRIVSLWFLLELRIPAIPVITYGNEDHFSFMLDGLCDCGVVAFSVFGTSRAKADRDLARKAIAYTVDHLKRLTRIIVMSVAGTNERVLELFAYAIAKGIVIDIPTNRLQTRNRLLQGGE